LRLIGNANNDRAAILTVKQAKGLRTAAHKGGSDFYLKDAPLKPPQNRIRICPNLLLVTIWSQHHKSKPLCSEQFLSGRISPEQAIGAWLSLAVIMFN
jgi:hypothetical protein